MSRNASRGVRGGKRSARLLQGSTARSHGRRAVEPELPYPSNRRGVYVQWSWTRQCRLGLRRGGQGPRTTTNQTDDAWRGTTRRRLRPPMLGGRGPRPVSWQVPPRGPPPRQWPAPTSSPAPPDSRSSRQGMARHATVTSASRAMATRLKLRLGPRSRADTSLRAAESAAYPSRRRPLAAVPDRVRRSSDDSLEEG